MRIFTLILIAAAIEEVTHEKWENDEDAIVFLYADWW